METLGKTFGTVEGHAQTLSPILRDDNAQRYVAQAEPRDSGYNGAWLKDARRRLERPWATVMAGEEETTRR